MGLLDALQSPDGQLGLGLLAAAGPSATPMSFGQRLSGAMQQFQAAKIAEEERRQKAAMQALQAKLIESQIGETQAQALQRQAQADAAARRQTFLSRTNPNNGPALPVSAQDALANGITTHELPFLMPEAKKKEVPFGKIDPKDYTQESIAAFSRTGDYTVLRPVPKEQLPDEFERSLRLAGIDPASPQGRTLALERAKKMATHQPGVSVTYGAPMAGEVNGKQVFFQPSKDGGPPSIIQGVAPPAKEMPSALAEKFAQNAVTLGKIEKAISLVESNPNALGAKNYLPDALVQRLDPSGVDVRAMVADISGQKVHDRAGASQTVGEVKRLQPYIPNPTDDAPTVKKKLRLFQNEYTDMQRALASGASLKQAATATSSTGQWGIRPLP